MDDSATILIVDDAPANIDVLVGILGDTYRLKVATSGEKALQLARSEPVPDLVLLDVVMPGMDGLETCRQLQADALTSAIPVVFVTALDQAGDEAQGFDAGGVDYITKPVSPAVVRARVRTHLDLHDQRRHLAGMVQQRTAELEQTRLEIIRKLGRAAEYKDDETGLHVIRMAQYTRLVAIEYGLPDHVVDKVYQAAPMHDIGKIGIPDAILRKPGKLDDDEWSHMQEHTTIGGAIIGDSDHVLLATARQMALSHHEKWDGSGYPAGLAGEQIPLAGRIAAVADVFDALTSVRPYKPAWEVDRAVELIESEAGRHFAPDVAACFLRVLPDVLEVKAQFAEDAERDDDAA